VPFKILYAATQNPLELKILYAATQNPLELKILYVAILAAPT
jgi:hypothetical protein